MVTGACVMLALGLGVAAAAGSGGEQLKLPPGVAVNNAGISGLADGRVYEQVSSQKKNGNEAGIELQPNGSTAAAYAAAAGGGNRVVYSQPGPSGQTASGSDFISVSDRNPEKGWGVSATLPPAYLANGDVLGQVPLAFLPSADLSRFLFVAAGPFVEENSSTVADENMGLYRTRGYTNEPEWLSEPTNEVTDEHGVASFPEAKPPPGRIDFELMYPVGGSPDLNTVYFTDAGTLVPEDASRRPQVDPAAWKATERYLPQDIVEEGGQYYVSLKPENEGHKPSEPGEWWAISPPGRFGIKGPWGFYEWKEGALQSAGVLPSNSPIYPNKPDPYGAVPAVTLRATGSSRREPFARFLLNEVSQDGSKAFFVSPDPSHAGEAGTPTELYLREQIPGGPPKTVLVSRDEAGAPAPGSGFETAVTPVRTQWAPRAYVFASPDGSRAFFQSKDKLAKDASGTKEPDGSGPWTYEFNLATEKVTYLPGVIGPIAASSEDGSSFIFKNTSTKKIELWKAGGSEPEEIASYSTSTEPEFEAVATKHGAVFVFNTNAILTGKSQTFNNSAGMEQSYRYETSPSHALACVSCAPEGVAQQPVEAAADIHARLIADEGKRVFFGTAAKLVSGDKNEVADAYEWEAAGTGSCSTAEREGGCVYLISSGTGSDPSFYLENDESGENVFFSTREGLVKADTDGSYDVYDARVNGGGFPEPPPPAECGGSCRPPGTTPSLDSSLSAAIGSSGNLTPGQTGVAPSKQSGNESASKPLTRAQKLAKALAACKKLPKKRRAACVRQARRRYASSSARHSRHRRHK
jgi:hypothetical protein